MIWYYQLCVYLLSNAIIGVALTERFLHQVRRHRNSDGEREKLFPGLKRSDVKNWTRCNLYPTAMTILFPRFMLAVLLLLLNTLFINIFTLGHDFKKGPIKNKCRKVCIKYFDKFITTLFAYTVFLRFRKKVHTD